VRAFVLRGVCVRGGHTHARMHTVPERRRRAAMDCGKRVRVVRVLTKCVRVLTKCVHVLT
jgi:hypothetical protein